MKRAQLLLWVLNQAEKSHWPEDFKILAVYLVIWSRVSSFQKYSGKSWHKFKAISPNAYFCYGKEQTAFILLHFFKVCCLGKTLKTYCVWSHKSHKQLAPDTYIFNYLFWSSSVAYISLLPSSLFLFLSAFHRLWKIYMIRSFTRAALLLTPPSSHQTSPKSPRPRLTPKAGLYYSRSHQCPYQQDYEAASRSKKRERKCVISWKHGH